MILVKNKASGKFFIVLDDNAENYLHLITPEGRIKRLERHLFSPIVRIDHRNLSLKENLTPAQMDTYMDHEEYADY